MKYAVIPQPVFFQLQSEETAFELTRYCELECHKGTEKAEKDLLRFLEENFGSELPGTGKEAVKFVLCDEGEKEGYTLKVEKDSVTLTAIDEAGLFYGVQSLKQLLIQGNMQLPELEIKDCPNFKTRGFMLDCARYFFTKEAVMHFLDMMALHKLNEFHWHLSDDQGFRCQLEDNLLLTEIGSYRSHTNFNSTPHQGYYTKSEMKEIVEYAHERFIKVVPEIDTPGHVVSMIAAYPFLSCFDRKMTVATHWGIKNDVLCVGKESTFKFMEGVFDELTQVFTDGVIHLGGDEVPTLRWKLCPHCQKRMKEEGMKEAGELHTYYLQRIASYLQKKGFEVRMWNDRKKEKMVNSSVAWQLWNGEMKESEAAEEINGGRKFVVSSSCAYYLDLPYGQVNLRTTYDYNPVFEGVKDELKNNIEGIEACLWTEFVPDMKKAHFCAFPRLGAFCETAWTKPENKDFDRFLKAMVPYFRVLYYYGVEPAKLSAAMPKNVRKLMSLLYWERRRFCWAPLYNLVNNYSVKKTAEKGEKND